MTLGTKKAKPLARMVTLMHDYPEQLHTCLELVRVFDNREVVIFFVDDPGDSDKSFFLKPFCIIFPW